MIKQNLLFMKKILVAFALFIPLLFSSCTKDPCYIGSWTLTNPPWILATTVDVDMDNTGTMIVVDPTCPASGSQTRVYNFSWTSSDNIFAFAFSTQGKKCGESHTFTGQEVITGLTGTLTCEGDAMTLDAATWDYHFTRN